MDLAVLENDPATSALRIAQLIPEITVEAVRAETEFPSTRSRACARCLPAADDLLVLRADLNPARVYLKKEEKFLVRNRWTSLFVLGLARCPPRPRNKLLIPGQRRVTLSVAV